MTAGAAVRLGRVYDDPSPDDGMRVLVDRLWPRGLRKDSDRINRWCPRVAPSTTLRRWYGHDPDRFDEFTARYRAELASGEPAQALAELAALVADDTVTLLTASKQVDQSHLTVLAAALTGEGRRR